MREGLPLKQHEITGFGLMPGYIGVLLTLIGGIIPLPLLTLLWYPEEAREAKYSTLPGIGSVLFGYLLLYNIRGKETGQLQCNQDAVVVVTCWILATMICALPFLLSGNYTSTQAVFETVSAWNTTGLNVVDVEHTSHLFLMHCSTILFFGSIGSVLAISPVLSDTYGMRLYVVEGHNDRLLPNLLKSTRIILTMYLCYILSGVALYCLFGMSPFDILIHSIGALSTGGFSSHAQGIGYYDNIWIEMITIILTLLGNINSLAHLFLIRGKLRNSFQYCEIHFSLLVIVLTVPVLGFLLCAGMGTALPHALRTALLQAVSALATTDLQAMDTFVTLSPTALLLLIVPQLIGGGIGSTASGIKQHRIHASCKGIWWDIKSQLRCENMIHSHKISRANKKEAISPTELLQMGLYVVLYFCLSPLESSILCCYDRPLAYNMSEFSSVLSIVGLSAGIMTCGALSLVLWTGATGMFTGRLEVYVVPPAVARLGEDVRSCVRRRKTV